MSPETGPQKSSKLLFGCLLLGALFLGFAVGAASTGIGVGVYYSNKIDKMRTNAASDKLDALLFKYRGLPDTTQTCPLCESDMRFDREYRPGPRPEVFAYIQCRSCHLNMGTSRLAELVPWADQLPGAPRPRESAAP